MGSVSDQVLLYRTRWAALWVAWLPLEQEGAHILRCAVLAASCRQTHHGIETAESHGVVHVSLAHIVASVRDVNTPQHAELAVISSLKAVLNTFLQASNTVTMSAVDHADNKTTFGQVLAHGRVTRPRWFQ